MKSKIFFYAMSEYTTMIVSITLPHAKKKINSIFKKIYIPLCWIKTKFFFHELMHNIIIIIYINKKRCTNAGPACMLLF